MLDSAVTKIKTTFLDPETREICQALLNKYIQLLRAKQVYRGSYDTAHLGGTYTGAIHVDPRILDNAREFGGSYYDVLAQIVLHEAAHAAGTYGHHDGETQAPYSSFPYNYTNGGPTEQCVQS